MTLSFKTKDENGHPTDFVARIWDGLILYGLGTQEERDALIKANLISVYRFLGEEDWQRDAYAKIHTIREDKHDRWKAGMMIDFVVNNRTPQRRVFAPRLQCISTQKIRIEKEIFNPKLYSKVWNLKRFQIWIDNEPFGDHGSLPYDEDAVEYIAHHDGFQFDLEFMDWWPAGEWEGKIIHWTPFRYEKLY